MSDPLASEHESTNSGIPSIDDKDFPVLYQRADQAAIQRQRSYFYLHWFYLFFLILGAGGAVFASIIPETFSTLFHSGIIIILIIGIAINFGSHVLRHDEKWFECRAIAESTKTAAWRFMMKATPFDDDSIAEKTLISKIKEIRNYRQSGLDSLAKYKNLDAKPISDFMKNVRVKGMEERKNYYLESRVHDQRTWYLRKADSNSKNKSLWLTITLGLQGFAVIYAMIQVISTLPVNLVPILMTCAAASIAWSRMKRYSELIQSYTIVAHELEELEAMASGVTQESEFCRFVNDVEYAISREHTMWCVRRDVTINPNN